VLDPILKNLMQGITVIEDEYGSVNRIISKQLGAFAEANGKKKVCFLEPPSSSTISVPNGGEYDGFDMPPEEAVLNSGGDQKNTVIYRTQDRYLPLEELKFDLIVFDSFSSYIFGMSEKEVVDLMDEIRRLSRKGKTFALTVESQMLSDRVLAYLRSIADSLIIVKSDVNQNKINRYLVVPKILGQKPMDRIVKITIEDTGVDIDTREFVG
jgi:hypothetical protein